MAYGQLELITDNYILTPDMIIPSSQAAGTISGAQKTGTGVATLILEGSFTGRENVTYEAEIDSVAGGQEVGQATFKWRSSDNAVGVWQETGVLTRTSPLYALGTEGVTIGWIGRTGNDFEVGDRWQWFTSAVYGPKNLLDRNRMTAWRSTGIIDESLIFNFGTPDYALVIILHDHNLTANATVTIEGNYTDSWTSPDWNLALDPSQDPIFAYIFPGDDYAFFRLHLEDPTNPAAYLEAANVLLGSQTSLERVNADWGSRSQDGYVLQSNQSMSGVSRRYAYASQRTLELTFGATVKSNDVATLQEIQASLIDPDTKQVKPLWIHLFKDQPETLSLHDWENIEAFSHEFSSYLLNSGISLVFPEAVKV